MLSGQRLLKKKEMSGVAFLTFGCRGTARVTGGGTNAGYQMLTCTGVRI